MKMKHWKEGGVLLALTAAFAATTVTWTPRVDAKPGKKGIVWQKNMTAAIKEAKRTGKPIMVDFYATWCGPCKMLDEQTYSNAAVIKEAKKFVSVKVDVDKEGKLAEKYKVRAMPTVAFLKPNGALVTSFEGFMDAKSAVKFMRTAHAKVKKASKVSA